MRWTIVVCCLAALMLGACTRGRRGPKEPVFVANDAVAAAPSVEDEAYVIETGDFLAVASGSRPEVGCVGRVDDKDGKAALKLIQYVDAAGSTTGQFAARANDKYKEVKGFEQGVADLTVEVKRGLYLVTGEIAEPGFRAYTEGLTIYDAVVAGGEMTRDALEDRVFLNRKGAKGRREIFRYSKLEQLKELPLEENDWIIVPYKVDFILH